METIKDKCTTYLKCPKCGATNNFKGQGISECHLMDNGFATLDVLLTLSLPCTCLGCQHVAPTVQFYDEKKLKTLPFSARLLEIGNVGVARIQDVLELFYNLKGNEDPRACLSDIITDLKHWADATFLNFYDCSRNAQTNYLGERAALAKGVEDTGELTEEMSDGK